MILGEIYRDGLGVTRDYNEALKWYRQAAALGDDDGKRNVGTKLICAWR